MRLAVTHRFRLTGLIAPALLIALASAAASAQNAGAKERLELSDSANRPTARTTSRPATARASSPTLPAAERADSAPRPANTAGARVDFVRNQSMLGVAIYAPAFATTVASDGLAWGASYLLVAGGSFVAAAEVSRWITVTDPMQRLATWLPIHGAIAGSMSAALLDADQKGTAGAMLFGSLGGAAMALWKGRSMNDAEAAATVFGADVLGLAGYGVATAGGAPSGGDAGKARLGAALGGMVLGAPAGHAYAALARYHVTAGDLTAASAAGGVGMLAGLSVLAGRGDVPERDLATALTIGGLAGLVAGDRLLVSRYDHTPSEGRLVALGGVAGGLMGAGVAMLSRADGGEWGTVSAALTTAGAAVGIGLTQRYMLPKADGGLRLSGLTLHPAGVLAAATGMRGSCTLGSIRF